MELNNKQKEALKIIEEGNNIFITGSAGTGKSFLLKNITKYLNINSKKYAITATTGCSAVLINGQTINSYLYLGLNIQTAENIYKKYNQYLNKVKDLDVIIIDEISMMSDDLLEKINELLCLIRSSELPFGGIQIILLGDFCQLAPVSGNYCFLSKIWDTLNLNIVILTELMRQKEDEMFQSLLEEIRSGNCSSETYKILKSLKHTKFDNNIKPTKLFSLNENVDKINEYNFKKLCIRNNNNITIYNAKSSHKNIDVSSYNIALTLNTQIIITRNLSFENKLINGTRGVITELNSNYVLIKDINNDIHKIEYYTDRNDNNKTWISFLPIKLAYALSIHKSQGTTIDALEIDLGDDIFASGQLYTAISRAKSLKSIKITNISKKSFIIDPNVKRFYNLS
jgi:ATP-dependent exoDNAse (exonuclease V) alpha subunit